jgi:TolB-like protein
MPALLTGVPVVAADEPETPAARTTPAVSDNRVLVLAFAAEGGDAAGSLGRSAQQSLATDLSAAGTMQVATRKTPADDTDAALAAARDAGARYVVFGHIQQVGQDVRVNGQMLDAKTGRAVVALKVTGPTSNFFAMQDALGRQAVAAVGGGSAREAATTSSPAAPIAPAAAAPSYAAPTAPAGGTYWSEYMDLYEPVPAPAMGPMYPPNPPIPPMYGNSNYNPYAFGGGSFSNTVFQLPDGVSFVQGPLGTVHTETFNTIGHSIINPPVGQSQTGFRAAASFYAAPGSPTPLAPYAAPISAYKNPWAKFAAPVGLPQRVAPPNLRPSAMTGSAAPAAARSSGAARPAAKGR